MSSHVLTLFLLWPIDILTCIVKRRRDVFYTLLVSNPWIRLLIMVRVNTRVGKLSALTQKLTAIKQRLNFMWLEHVQPSLILPRPRGIKVAPFLRLELLNLREPSWVEPKFFVKFKHFRKLQWVYMLVIQWIIVVVSNRKVRVPGRLYQLLRNLEIYRLAVEKTKTPKKLARVTHGCFNSLFLKLLWQTVYKIVNFCLFPLIG
jgi:hypothetical protein